MSFLDFLRLILEQFESHVPHFAHIVAQLEGGDVFVLFVVGLDAIQVQEVAVEFVETGVGRVESLGEEVDAGMGLQELEDLVATFLDIRGVDSRLAWHRALLLDALVLTADLAVVHAG